MSNTAFRGDAPSEIATAVFGAEDLRSFLASVNPSGLGDNNSSRYFKVNFTSFVKYGTVEFRQRAATFQPKGVISWIEFLLELTRNVLKVDEEVLQTYEPRTTPLVPNLVSQEMWDGAYETIWR